MNNHHPQYVNQLFLWVMFNSKLLVYQRACIPKLLPVVYGRYISRFIHVSSFSNSFRNGHNSEFSHQTWWFQPYFLWQFNIAIENDHRNSRFSHYKRPCSTALWVITGGSVASFTGQTSRDAQGVPAARAAVSLKSTASSRAQRRCDAVLVLVAGKKDGNPRGVSPWNNICIYIYIILL